MTTEKIPVVSCRFCGVKADVCQHIEAELRRLWALADAYGLLLTAAVDLMAASEILAVKVSRLPGGIPALASIRSATEGVSGARANLARVLVNEPWREKVRREVPAAAGSSDPPREEPTEQPEPLRTVDGAPTS